MQPTVEKFGDVAVVVVNVEQLDASIADDFKSDMAPILKENSKVVLDLNRVQFVDSRGCGVILSCLKQLSAAGGDLRICQVSRPVKTVFELVRLHRVCEIHETAQQAVEAFRA